VGDAGEENGPWGDNKPVLGKNGAGVKKNLVAALSPGWGEKGNKKLEGKGESSAKKGTLKHRPEKF